METLTECRRRKGNVFIFIILFTIQYKSIGIGHGEEIYCVSDFLTQQFEMFDYWEIDTRFEDEVFNHVVKKYFDTKAIA